MSDPFTILIGIGIALWAIGLLMLRVPHCTHKCEKCKEEADMRYVKNVYERHKFEHKWWRISDEDCETCKRFRNQ